jgi:hypothetical protein
MSSVRRILLTVALGAVLGAGPAIAGPAQADHGSRRSRDLAALLTGSQEVPGPGDTNAWGAANIRIWPSSGRLCYTLFVRNVDGTIDGAHIHAGAWGVAGDVVVPLVPPVNGWSRDCLTVEKTVAADLVKAPRKFYVNVHSKALPAGAIRGQLTGQRRWWRS